ncbi:hypothetical protein B0J17DRAFT_390147 [Rhizoctonia solani]|nr:hypothetical protein B0J17DRAFT_390147 [Rhizoctonia solani]
MSTPDPAWRVKRTPCPFYQSGRCVFKHRCNFIHDGDINMRRSDVRAHVPVYRRTPENSVDSFSSSEDDEPAQEHQLDEHSAAAPSLIFSSIYGPRPNSINRLQLANVDLPVSPESLPHTPPRTSRPTSHHSTHNILNITSPTPSRPLSSSLGIGIGGRAQGGLAEVFTAIANTQAQATSTALPPSSSGSLPSPLSLSPKSPPNDVQEIIIKDQGYSLEQLPFKLALSNQSSLLLNRAAQRRSSSLSHRQSTSSSSGADREKRPTNPSVPERLSISSLPKPHGDRAISVSSIEYVEEEGQADDEGDAEEQEIVDESPSFEALQPYPRDVSIEPSPDPTRQGFIPPAPVPPPPPAQQPPKPHGRNNSARHIDHELVIDELEERLGVEPTRRRRARSNAVPNPSPSGISPNRSTSQPTGTKADATWQRKPPIQMPKSDVNMGAARDMLSAMFAKREQQTEEKPEEHSSDEQSFLPVDWDIGSMAGLEEEDRLDRQEAPVPPEPAIVQVASTAVRRKSITVRRESTTVRRESTGGRRKSTAPQSQAPIPISQPSPPIPVTRPTPQPDAHPQTPSTASTIPETPNTQLTQSTQPTPPSDHTFEETDTDDEHPEDLADLIEAEPVVLSTPRSVVLRREIGRETSLSSRTGTGAGTPGAWTPRPGSGAWTPARGSIIGGSGGLQVMESPTAERVQHERRLSFARSQPSPNERRQSTSGQRFEDITQSTISEATLNTMSGQTEDVSPVSRALVSDCGLVSVPAAAPIESPAPIESLAPILGSVPSSPSGLGSGNGLGSGVPASDIVSPLPFVSTPSGPVTPGNALRLGVGEDSELVPSVPSSSSSKSLGSGPVLPVATQQSSQATCETPVSLSPAAPVSAPLVVPTLEPSIASIPRATPPSTPGLPHSVTSVASMSETSATPISPPLVQPIEPRVEPAHVRSALPESAPQVASDSVPRAEPELPVARSEHVVFQESSGLVPSVESSPLPSPSSESNLVARSSPSLVAGPDSKHNSAASLTLDRDSTLDPVYSSESSAISVEPIRDSPHGDRGNSDSERVASRLSRDTVESHVPRPGGPSGGERGDSYKLVEDLHGDGLQISKKKNTVREGSVRVVKENGVTIKNKDRAEASSAGPAHEENAANIQELHEELQTAVQQDAHQGLVEEGPRAISTSVHRDAAAVSKEDDRDVQQDLDKGASQIDNADIDAKVVFEPTTRSGDVRARALVSDSGLEPARNTIPIPASSPPSGPISEWPSAELEPRISQDSVAERSTENVAQDTPSIDEAVVQASIPSAKQTSAMKANKDEAHDEAQTPQDVPPVEAERGEANMGSRMQEDQSVEERINVDEPLSGPTEVSATVESVEERSVIVQEVSESGIREDNKVPKAREFVAGASPKDNDPTAEQPAKENDLEGQATLQSLVDWNPSVRSEPSLPAPVPELGLTTEPVAGPASLNSPSTDDEVALEPDHADSLSELEESFGVRSDVKDESMPKPALPQQAAPSSPPAISFPTQASVPSPLPAPEQSPMLPPLSPIAPLSPILPSSPSVSPSLPEPLSPPTSSSPPTTSSLPGSPSPALSLALPIAPSAPEPQQSVSQSLLSPSTKALSDVPTVKQEAPLPPDVLSQPTLLESEQSLSQESFSKVEPSIRTESLAVPETPTLPHSPPSDSPPPSESRLLSETPLLPESPPSGILLPTRVGSTTVPEPVAPERIKLGLSSSIDRAPEPELVPASQPSSESSISPSELPLSPSRPQSTKPTSRKSSLSHEPTVLPQSSSPPEPSLVPEPLETPAPFAPSSVSTPSEDAQVPETTQPIVDEPIPTLATSSAAELPQLHESPLLPTPSMLPDPEPCPVEPSPVEPDSPSSEFSHPNPELSEPELLDGPHSLTSRSVLPASPEPSLSEAPSLLVPSEPIVLPELSQLPNSAPVPNSSPLLNDSSCLPNVSIPLEPLSSPRSPSLSELPPSPEPAELPEPSPLPGPSSLHESSPLIAPPLFEPSPWPGLSVPPKPSPSSSLLVSSFHEPPSLPGPPYSSKSSPSPNPGPLPGDFSALEPSAEPELPPTEDLQGSEQPTELDSSHGERPDEAQELQVTPGGQRVRGTPDPLSPWGSLRLRKSSGVQNTPEDEQQPPKSSLLFDCASLPADSPPGPRTPLSRLPTLPEDSSLPQYAPPPEHAQPEEHTGGLEGDSLSERIESLRNSGRGDFAMSLDHSGESRSPSPVEEPHFSQRSSLSEILSLSDFAPLGPRSNTAPQYVRTASLASEPRATSEPSSKPRPRSQLKPLRLSLMHGLGTPSPSAIITPVSANTVTPSPGFRSEVATPTPTAMYPTPSSAHPTQRPALLRSTPQSPPTAEDTNAMPHSYHEPSELDSVSWFGSKKGVKRGTLSATRQSIHRSVQGSNRSSLLQSTSDISQEQDHTSVIIAQSSPRFPVEPAEDEDVRPLPRIWDDESEVGSRAGSSRQGTRSPTQSQSRYVPVLEAFSPDTAPVDVAPPLKTPDRLDTVPRYPTFVNVASSPRTSEGRSPLPSPPVPAEPASEPPSEQQSEVQPAASRSRKWADTIDQGSIGSLPDFDAPAPGTQMLDGQSPKSKEPHTPSKPKDRRHYMKIPNTAPLAISPRRVSPSIMQRAQEDSMGSYEEDAASQDEMQSYTTPHTAPLDLRLRMSLKEGTTGPWMAEHFTNSPSSFHSSQVGSMHSASSSLSTGAKAVGIRRSIVGSKQVNRPVHIEDETFGNPGPGPSTMKTYSERRQSAEFLRSPIALQSPVRERAPSVPKTPQPHVANGTVKKASRQLSLASVDATPRKAQDALQLKVSPAESTTEIERSTDSGIPNAIPHPSVHNEANDLSPTEQRTPYKALSMSSPSPGQQPLTPLTAASPLQILRRNLMARTSPESPRFLSPQMRFTNLPESRTSRHQHAASASLAPMTHMRDEFRSAPMSAPGPRDRRSLTPNTRFAATPSIPGSPAQSVHSTISQTKPLLFFAIAKNSAQEVERLLQDGEVKPNDKAGPEDLPALAFALANEQLSDKTQIVKSLLSHGADPSSVLHRQTGSGQFDDADLALTTRIEQGMNPAIRYYLNRKQMTIPAPQAELLEKHNFGGLTRAGFSIIGQDAALEELIRVVAGHCRRQALNPLVVVFSGGPGCGKSLLASKIGPLLHVPYFTVNMTNLRNEAALFNYISMTTKVGQPQIPLVDFLRNNQGRRCVVVLEEIEKAADKTVWHSLLMPWEWGKATVICPTTNEQIDIDTTQVIWIATSNSGDDATLKFFAERSRPSERGESSLARLAHHPRSKEDNFTRKDYLQLMQAVRKRLGEILGSSMISRVSSVLPFLPFTEDEVYALASESLSAMRSEQKGDQNYENVDWEELLQQAVGEYIPGEGARSVHRAVQRAFDEIMEW